jgi:hypothetical protein
MVYVRHERKKAVRKSIISIDKKLSGSDGTLTEKKRDTAMRTDISMKDRITVSSACPDTTDTLFTGDMSTL